LDPIAVLHFRIFPVARIFFTSSDSKSLLCRILFQEQMWQAQSRNRTQSRCKSPRSTEAEKRITNVTFTVWHPVRHPCWVGNEGNWQYNRSLAVDTGRSPSARTWRLIVSEACKNSLRIEWSWQTPCTYFKDRHFRPFQSLTLKNFSLERKISTLFASSFCVFLQRLWRKLHICDCLLSVPIYITQNAAYMHVHWTVCSCNEYASNIRNIILFEGLENFYGHGNFEVQERDIIVNYVGERERERERECVCVFMVQRYSEAL
jgi:hypothetical protein